jgi:hypothetical protein
MNSVEQYLHDNPRRNYNMRSLRSKLSISKREVFRHVMESTHLRAVDPLKVGSGKQRLFIFEYHEYPGDQLKYSERAKMNTHQVKKNVLESKLVEFAKNNDSGSDSDSDLGFEAV